MDKTKLTRLEHIRLAAKLIKSLTMDNEMESKHIERVWIEPGVEDIKIRVREKKMAHETGVAGTSVMYINISEDGFDVVIPELEERMPWYADNYLAKFKARLDEKLAHTLTQIGEHHEMLEMIEYGEDENFARYADDYPTEFVAVIQKIEAMTEMQWCDLAWLKNGYSRLPVVGMAGLDDYGDSLLTGAYTDYAKLEQNGVPVLGSCTLNTVAETLLGKGLITQSEHDIAMQYYNPQWVRAFGEQNS